MLRSLQEPGGRLLGHLLSLDTATANALALAHGAPQAGAGRVASRFSAGEVTDGSRLDHLGMSGAKPNPSQPRIGSYGARSMTAVPLATSTGSDTCS